MSDLEARVMAVERAYVAARTGDPVVAAACMGAVASRFLAVGTPRSIGLVGHARAVQLSLDAHRVWFSPGDVRIASVVGLDAALAADIVCIHDPIEISASKIRRGTHLNVLHAGAAIDRELLATVTHEIPGLADLAAGIVDGRQLDEITVFVIGDGAVARSAI